MKTRSIVFGFVVGFFLSLAEISASQIQEEFLRVSVPRANVRVSPSLKGEVVFQASGGDTLRVIRKEGNWYLIEAESGRKGYVSEIVVRVLEVKKVEPEPGPAIVGIVGDRPLVDKHQPGYAFNNEDIIAMARAGLSDNIIISAIRTAALTKFDLTPSGIIALKKGGVSERVIQALLDRLNPGVGIAEESSLDKKNLKADESQDSQLGSPGSSLEGLPRFPRISSPGRFGIGANASLIYGGLAPGVLYDLNDRLTASGALGLYSGVTGFTGELLYRLPGLIKNQPSEVFFEPYFGGGLGLISVSWDSGSPYVGFIGSGGVFVTLKKTPRVRFSGNVNFIWLDIDTVSVAGGGIKFGLHYFF